ncbi:MAG: RibD family protein [Salinarimonadaceae bacterium]|nr:MAG: RibD family protein [Salinarimonadaceae bacterium]
MQPCFAPFCSGTTSRPFVVAQLGQSLDGRIATVTGDSKYINGGAALDHLHALRAHVDAVVVGVGTVAADDPLLTVRRTPGVSPARVVIDPSGRLPAAAACLADDGARRIVVGGSDRPGAPPPGVEFLRVERGRDGLLAPAAIVAALGRAGFARILIEGGARTVSDFLAAACVDRLHMLVAPVLIGSGKAGLDLPVVETLAGALRPATRTFLLDGGDVLFDCDLRAEAGSESMEESPS